jgi:hypothetical protein
VDGMIPNIVILSLAKHTIPVFKNHWSNHRPGLNLFKKWRYESKGRNAFSTESFSKTKQLILIGTQLVDAGRIQRISTNTMIPAAF